VASGSWEPVRQWNRSHPFPVSSTGPTI